MRVFVNGNEVGSEYAGCALCGDNRRTGTYLSIDGTLRCKVCGRPWRGFYGEVAGSKLYFCCGDHYREFRRIVQRVITEGNVARIRAMFISVHGGERIIRIEGEDGKEVTLTEPMPNLVHV